MLMRCGFIGWFIPKYIDPTSSARSLASAQTHRATAQLKRTHPGQFIGRFVSKYIDPTSSAHNRISLETQSDCSAQRTHLL